MRARAALGLLALLGAAAAVAASVTAADRDRNAYQLPGTPYFKNGYEWWWHSLVARSRRDGSLQPFFIEYFVINPGRGGPEIVHTGDGRQPSYGMLMAGAWGARKAVLKELFPITAFAASTRRMDVRLGPNRATDTELHGEMSGAPDATGFAEHLAWNLRAEKMLSYDIGFLGGRLFQWVWAFDMLWHVPGMQARYAGTVEWNGVVYDVAPGTSRGYQDENWGRDYTAPWYWLRCNDFTSRLTGKPLELTSLDLGGGVPRIFGIPLGHDKLLIALRHSGEVWEWNFTHLFDPPTQAVDVEEQPDRISWPITAENRRTRIEIAFKNPTSEMVQLVYENPKGQVALARLWNRVRFGQALSQSGRIRPGLETRGLAGGKLRPGRVRYHI